MADGAASEIGRNLRAIRLARKKSLAVIAGRAGISVSYLSRLESGERALDRRSLILDLANALEVAPTELTGPGMVELGTLAEDASLPPVRRALLTVSMGAPAGTPTPVEALRERVTHLLDAQRACDYVSVGEALPGLIGDLHATLATGHRDREVLELLPLFHVQGTQAWLMDVGAPIDLAWHAVTLAKQAAARLDDPMAQAVTSFGTAFGLMAGGVLDLASQTLHESLRGVGTASTSAMQVAGMLSLTDSLVAAAAKDEARREAALDQAADLATHTGEGNALWFGFGPANVDVWRMSVALESGDHALAATIAAGVNPEALSSPTRRAAYWREYGRALARLPRRQDEAVLMLRRAEKISPTRIHRHPFMRSVLAELLARAKRDAVGRELRGMAYRAGLPV